MEINGNQEIKMKNINFIGSTSSSKINYSTEI